MISQVAVAWHLQGAHQALHLTLAVPRVIVKTKVCEVAHGDERLLAQCPQAVVLQQQCGELCEALEGPLFHQRDLVLLQVQTGQCLVSREGSVAEDFDAVPCQEEVLGRLGPRVRGRDGSKSLVLAVDEDLV